VEETGLRCELGPELASTSYRDARDRRKHVRYWAMRPVDGSFEARHEVDEVRWLPLAEAPGLLAYKGEREMAERALVLLAGDDNAL
jgi:8-oxo-dGTP pyrophosphatase MutT (NUDIX family)